MASKRLDEIYLLGKPSPTITGNKLPSKRQVLQVFFHLHNEEKKTIREAASGAISEALPFWEKARIPVRLKKHLIKKLEVLFNLWKGLRKSNKKKSAVQSQKEKDFKDDLDNLFDMAHQDALDMITIVEDKEFLIAQREKGRRGSMAGVDLVLTEKEVRAQKRKVAEEKRKLRSKEKEEEPKTAILESSSTDNTSSAESSELELSEAENVQQAIETPGPSQCIPPRKRARKDIVSPGLASALDRTKVSDRKAAFVISEAVKSVGLDTTEYNINRSSISRGRQKNRRQFAEVIKRDFHVDTPLVVHWDGKLMEQLTKKQHVERLPILVSGEGLEKLLGVPKLSGGTGENQATAVIEALEEWGITDKVIGMCFDTTASNTGIKSGACLRIEQKLGRDLFYFACRHHILELILSAAFTSEMGSTTSGPDVLLFKQFKARWETIDKTAYQVAPDDEHLRQHLPKDLIQQVTSFATSQLTNHQPRDDYKEFLELALLFLGAVPPRGVRFLAPGAYHHACWMSKALYTIKIWLFRAQIKLTAQEERGMREISLFVVTVYLEAWFSSSIATEAPRRDLNLMKRLIQYGEINSKISKATSNKFRNHLWYLSEDLVALAFFDPKVLPSEKKKMVLALGEEGHEEPVKRPHPTLDEFQTRTLSSFVSMRTKESLIKFGLDVDVLDNDPSTWPNIGSFQEVVNKVSALSVTNDTAERGVALIQDYNKLLTKQEDQLQFLLQIVAAHRTAFPDSLKSTLTQNRLQ